MVIYKNYNRSKPVLNLEWLRSFALIYEKGNLTKAAESLLISQPGASLHLTSLENYIGFKLFERRPRQLIPTERGKQLYHAVIEPLKQLNEVEKHFQKSCRNDVATITIGMCFETFQMSLEKYLHQLDFNLIVEFGDYKELLNKLQQRIIDIVVTPHKRENTELCFTAFSQENIVLVAGKETDITPFEQALKQKDKEKMRHWMTAQIWYGLPGENEHLQKFWKQNFESHPHFRPNYIVPNIHSIVRSLSLGQGLAVIPDFLCKNAVESGHIQLLWKGFLPITNTLYLAVHKDNFHQKPAEILAKILQQEMPPLEPLL